jgi:hypothetical protein
MIETEPEAELLDGRQLFNHMVGGTIIDRDGQPAYPMH